MSEETSPASSPIVSPETPMPKAIGKKVAPIKNKNSPTDNQVQTRGHVKQSELVKWTVFVRPEVKIAVQKAAKKTGITDTAWLDSALWEAATADLSKKPQPPAKVEDMADILKQFTDRMEADQEATRKAQNNLIQQQGQQIEALAEAVQNNQPKSLKEMIFGKRKDD